MNINHGISGNTIRIGDKMTLGEIMTANVGSIIIGVVITVIGYLITRKITKTDKKAETREAEEHNRINKRINYLISCQFAMFDALEELGVNGTVKKEMDRLKEQVIED